MSIKKIKILLLIDTLKGGGVEEWVKEIVRLIDRDRFEITVCYLIDLRYKDDFSFADIIRKYGCDVEYIGFSKKKISSEKLKSQLHSKNKIRLLLQYLYLPVSLTHLPKLYGLIKKKKIDVIHSIMHYSFVLGALTSKIYNIPMIYQVSESRAQLSEGRPPWLFQAMRILQHNVKTFFTGLSEQELIIYGKIPKEKIKPIRGAIDVEDIVYIKPEQNPIISEFSLSNSYPILLSVGRFTPEKGHIHSIQVIEEVIKTFKQAKLIILGDGWEYEKIKDIINKKNLSKNVILPGFRTDLGNFHSAADIYIRTNLVETGTLSSYRAMAYGLPVVGFQNNMTDCITNYENGLLVPHTDSLKMADAVIKLSENEELRTELGKKAKDYILDNLDIKNAIRDFEEEYIRIVR